MKKNTSIVLGVTAVVLALFIFLYERDQPTTAELEERTGRVLADFSRDHVDRIVLGEGEDRIELVRQDDEEEHGDGGPPLGWVGQWRVTHPLDVEADDEAVDGLLSTLDWLERRALVEDEDAVSQPQYGLSEPRGRIGFRLRGRDVTLLVGGEAPGEALYIARADDNGRVFVVDQEFLEDITKEAGDVRNKQLTEITATDATAVRVVGRFHAARQGQDRWTLTTPVKMRADARGVDDVLRNLEQMRAKRFIEDGVDDDGLDRFGLKSPRREVRVVLEGQEESVALRFGGECEGHGGEIYVTVLGTGTVACVDEEIMETINVDPDGLRDLRLTRTLVEDIEGITIIRGDSELRLEKDGLEWQIGDGDVGADANAVDDFLTVLRGTPAEDVTTELGPLGGQNPSPDAEVRLRLAGDDAAAEIFRFIINDERVLIRRGNEEVALEVPAEIGDHIVADAIGFRNRTILTENPNEAVEIEITGSFGRHLLRKQEGIFRFTEPLQARADDTIVGDLVRSIAGLRVERFVASAPAPSHGLARPELTVRARFEVSGGGEDGGAGDGGAVETRDHILRIGAPVEGGRFAQLEGEDAVFIVSESLTVPLDAPLIDRDLFAVAEESVQAITIERGEERIELRRDGDHWVRGEERVGSSPVERMLTRIAVARATNVFAIGPAAPTMGFATPRGRILLTVEDGEQDTPEQMVIVIGAAFEEDETERTHVRRDDVDATFGLPERTVELFLSYSGE